MKHVSILGKESITIGHNLQGVINDFVIQKPCSTIAIISDIAIEKLGYVNELQKNLLETEKTVLKFCIADGEVFKTRSTKEKIEDFLLSNKCHRDTILIALGGGVVGDLVGFVASTYMRGVPVIQIPTTLLAMVDSSIGGKTGLDTKSGKNLIGAFHQPIHVFIDVRYLVTLPERHFCNGMAEVIKTAAIGNSREFLFLEENADNLLNSLSLQNGLFSDAIASILIHIVEESVKIKAAIVTKDEKEGGLRGLLNFGHTVGHGIEAAVFPDLLHGECVSLGMTIEAEISRHLNNLSHVSLGRLERLLKTFKLPTNFFSDSLRSRIKNRDISLKKLMSYIAIDKKNSGKKIKVVLLKDIGSTVENQASIVEKNVLELHLCKGIRIYPFCSNTKEFELEVPGSKSLSNRVLLVAALGQGSIKIQNLLHSEDTQVMLNALKMLKVCSFEFLENGNTILINGGGGKISLPEKEIFISNAGTAARFLTTALNLICGEVTLTGNERMKLRPIHPLVDALRTSGCTIEYLEKSGCLPLKIISKGFKGGLIELDAKISSQYVSSILLCAPYALEQVTLKLTGGTVISRQYIDMTLDIMAKFGVEVEQIDQFTFKIPRKCYENPLDYFVEPDASSATYPLAFAAVTNTKVTIPHLSADSTQGDSKFAKIILGKMGCEVIQDKYTSVIGVPRCLPLFDIDMEVLTDAFLTAAALGAITTEGYTKISGIANQRVKECNRITAMREGLKTFGVKTEEFGDGMTVFPQNDLKEGFIDCQEDHRVAMSFSLLGVKQGCVLNDRKCVEKTFPQWFDILKNTFEVKMEGVEIPEQKFEENTQNIYLIGMRGVGKSHFGKFLASKLQYSFLDLDDEIKCSLGSSIKEHIEQMGWQNFREIEYKILKKAMVRNKTVISCGGGIIDFENSKMALQECSDIVIFLQRDSKDLQQEFLNDENRPKYEEPFLNVYNRRHAAYYDTCDFEFRCFKINGRYDFDLLQNLFVDFVNGILKPTCGAETNFVCLTMPNYTFIENEQLLEITDSASAVEVRVDLLDSRDLDKIGEQIFYLKYLIKKPIIFTVRTNLEGGKFIYDEKQYKSLLEAASKWSCEYIDIEFCRNIDIKTKSKIISSYHSFEPIDWMSFETRNIANKMQQKEDLVKIIGFGEDLDPLLQFKKWFNDNFTKKLICCNMGNGAPLSRIFSEFVPVTHAKLSKAATGQLTWQKINEIKSQLGIVKPLQFYLFGYPISTSQSPTLHNCGFQVVGFPYKYNLFEANNVEKLSTILKDDDFGGASVTIPLKESILNFCDYLSPESKAIGAVNTVKKINGKLHGYNTDWIGVRDCALNLLGRKPNNVLVIGAGGTSRAACYAVNQWHVSLFIWNRTIEKARSLADQFQGEVLTELTGEFDLIIATIPHTAQTFQLPKSDYLVELSYSPRDTPFMKQISKNVAGIDILIAQGYQQFEIWTETTAPRNSMRKAVYQNFYKQK
eukprot:NODE_191_length_13422_cov_1.451025.p1 type:complete len:1469 gc:universal NODE_191_length_13422_cov_1.451025:7688-3282(-)